MLRGSKHHQMHKETELEAKRLDVFQWMDKWTTVFLSQEDTCTWGSRPLGASIPTDQLCCGWLGRYAFCRKQFIGKHQLPESQYKHCTFLKQAQNGHGSCRGHQGSNCNVTKFPYSKYWESVGEHIIAKDSPLVNLKSKVYNTVWVCEKWPFTRTVKEFVFLISNRNIIYYLFTP